MAAGFIAVWPGVSLISMAHPRTWDHDPPSGMLAKASLEYIAIDISLPPLPEVAFAYSGAEFNDHFDLKAVADLARVRGEARYRRKFARRARYRRQYSRQRRPTAQERAAMIAHALTYVVTEGPIADNLYLTD